MLSTEQAYRRKIRKAVELLTYDLETTDELLGKLTGLKPYKLKIIRLTLEQQKSVELGQQLTCVSDVIEVVGSYFSQIRHEEAHFLFCDVKQRLVGRKRFVGTLTHCRVDLAQVGRIINSLEGLACNLIMVHNHPSLDPAPSGDDDALTRRLAKLLDLLDFRFNDHIILAGDSSFSYRSAAPSLLEARGEW